MNPSSFISKSEVQTLDWACEFAQTLPPGTVVRLVGDIGAGKTVVARGIARGLAVSEPIPSPTFTIVNTYEGTAPSGKTVYLHHFDLYRINDAAELVGIGWEEYFEPDAICLVEWPERAGELLPIGIVITVRRVEGNDQARHITWTQEGEGNDDTRL